MFMGHEDGLHWRTSSREHNEKKVPFKSKNRTKRMTENFKFVANLTEESCITNGQPRLTTMLNQGCKIKRRPLPESFEEERLGKRNPYHEK